MSIHLLRCRPYNRAFKALRPQCRALRYKSPSDQRFQVQFIAQRRSTTRRIATLSVYFVTTFFLAKHTLELLTDLYDQVKAPGAGQDGKQEPLFIPLGRIKERPQEHYKDTDPEVTMLKEIAEDIEKEDYIKGKLIYLVRNGAAADKSISKALGKVFLADGHCLLRLWGAKGPPSEYERFGLEVDGFKISLTNKPMSRTDYVKERRALWPDVTLKAFLNSGRYLAFLLEQDRKAKLERIEDEGNMKQEQQSRPLRSTLPSSSSSSSSTPSEKAPISAKTPISASTTSSKPSTDSNTDMDASVGHITQQMANIFYRTLVTQRKRYPRQIPRGACLVEGRAEVVGQKGIIVVYISGLYDMKMKRYTSVQITIESFRRFVRTAINRDVGQARA